MNQVTIFSAGGCNNCQRLKAAFDIRHVPYVDISLSRNPEKIFDLVSLCQRNGVPQIFFQGEHIGGLDETIELLERWDREFGPDPLERFRGANAGIVQGPVDVRLTQPLAPPPRPSPPPPRNEAVDVVELPDDDCATILEMTSILMIVMPRADLPWRARTYKDCFTGRDGVRALMSHYDIDAEMAIDLGIRLQRARLLDHVCGDHEFGDNDYYFRLQPFHQPKVLNSFRIWTDRIDPCHMGIVSRLRTLMDKIESNATDPHTGLVDYTFAESDPHYMMFEEEVCELQGVCLREMNVDTRLAFVTNVYNIMIQHALIKVGVPTTSLQRGSFYSGVRYNIGGDVLSFVELEHGILRANRRPPYQLISPFSKGDNRARTLSLPKLDPRIHFALNCGASSCPPVKHFTANGVREELEIVTFAFCEDDSNVSIDEERNELSLSMIFHWYRSDFAESTSKLPHFILTYLRGERRAKLQRMIDRAAATGKNGRKIEVKFKPYDWNVKASSSKRFESSQISNPNEITLKTFFLGHAPSCIGTQRPVAVL